MTSHRVIWGAAVLAAVGRFCGFLWPLRPDEAGFLLVARTWDPQPDSVFGPHFVDRPPQLLAVVRAADAIGGPYFLRAVAAVGCAVAVLLAAELVRELARSLPLRVSAAPLLLVTTGTALLTAAVLVTPQIDAVAAKGEVLAVPLILASVLVALRSLRKTSAPLAALAGLLAMTATGLKQSLVGGLVFGGVLLLTAWVTRRIDRRTFATLAGAALAGAAVPVLATVGWAVAAGVDLSVLRYTVLGFRGDASAVIVEQTNHANRGRVAALLLVFATTGMALVIVWCLARARVALRRLTAPTVAALAMLAVDLTVIVLSGSYWTPYLFALVPPLVLVWACIRVPDLPPDFRGDTLRLRAEGRWHPRREVLLVALCVASSIVSLGGWLWTVWWTGPPPQQYVLGREIGRVAAPGDTLTVYGGRADLQWASGLDSPYEHLWSLPMRTADPELAELHDLLVGPEAPTWFVEAASLRSWDRLGADALQDVVDRRYETVGHFCDTFVVRRLKDAQPTTAPLAPDCGTSWGRR